MHCMNFFYVGCKRFLSHICWFADDVGYPCHSGVDDDDLDDLLDLDLSGNVSDSDPENGRRIELCPEELDSLPRLISEVSINSPQNCCYC